MNISHSKIELYSTCPAKYAFKYNHRLEPDKTFCALLFGISIDRALNYMLTRTKHKHIVSEVATRAIFLKSMSAWKGQNELIYFKNEAPTDIGDYPEEDQQKAVWNHLISVGNSMIYTYIGEIMPLFKEIISVQTRKEIPNAEGDTLVLITDFTARLHDNRIVTFDNKTTSDVKKNYGKSSVAKSQQLAIYTEFEESRLAGYIALSKVIKPGIKAWDMVIDTIPEENVEKAFNKVDDVLRSIKREEFPKNEKSCFSYGKKCDYWGICKNNSMYGLIEKKRK